ncbi:MAG: hypothetical protein ACFB03_01125 [Paracoccaceae bacterium]
MQATFDFETALTLALGCEYHQSALLVWTEIEGGLLLAAREDVESEMRTCGGAGRVH